MNCTKSLVDSIADSERADDAGLGKALLLELLGPTLNHDLPNLMVALQGFLQIFAQEVEGDLDGPANEYFQRISSIAQKLEYTVTTVKLINKVRTQSLSEDSIHLMDLLREVAATVQQRMPSTHVRFVSALKVKEFAAARSLLHQTLVEVLLLLAATVSGKDLPCLIGSRKSGGNIVLTLAAEPFRESEVARESGGTPPSPVSRFSTTAEVDYNLFGQEHRLDVLYVDEMVRRWGGEISTLRSPNQGKGISLTIPSI